MIVILGACHPLGQTAATAFADQGKRVIAIDDDAKALGALCAQNPGWIEAVPLRDVAAEMHTTLGTAWQAAPIELVVNLLPLTQPGDISAQMRNLTGIVKTTLRGLVLARGAMINVAARADDPLAFVAHGMGAALGQASAALAGAVAERGVQVHCLTLPAKGAGGIAELLKVLTTPTGRRLRSTTLDLTPARAKRAG